MRRALGFLLGSLVSTYAAWVEPGVLDSCPGYRAVNIQTAGNSLSADLLMAGKACNVFGTDITKLSLEVTYETETRIHLKISDPSTARYEVPDTVFPRPNTSSSLLSKDAVIRFNYTTSPFTFSINRASTNEVLFTTASFPLIFEPQYLRLKTKLPANPNIYGLGEHTDTFRLPTTNMTRTMWSRDAYGVPARTNLYGNHPIYFEHRTTGTHGVFLLNSNGMDIKMNDTEGEGTTLEYNVVGGVLDFYFLAGSETDPTEVARQYADLVGAPAEVPYWSFGFHQCRFGYTDFVDVAGVITNYSAAGIPLETMWTDIDYMDRRRIFTVDPSYFPLAKMQEIVDYLHSQNQKYVLMTDPAVAYLPGQGYAPFDRGEQLNIWLKNMNGSAHLGLVWPGVTVFPDWFDSRVQDYWTKEFMLFYDPQTGIDIDGAWIDMNEPSSFCNWPCDDPFTQAVEQALPPNRTTPPPDPDTPIFNNSARLQKRQILSDNDVLFPPYAIENAAGGLSNKTAHTDTKHANGLIEYNTHNVYGTMMSTATHNAMLARRPGQRTLVITRSTFAGAGTRVGKWLGDNFSQWDHYRFSIAGMLGMASIYQIPMVGSDICGYAEDTTETLCARWAMLGAFYPFMRNHNADTSISQEFYRWPSVTQAAKNALDVRYRFMDYIYTAFHRAHTDGTPIVNPLWYKYPLDQATYALDLQFLYGDSLLVSPVTEENLTSVSIYLPKDIFFDLATLAPVQGQGASVTLDNISFTDIPLHIRGGAVLPLRVSGAMTTTALRETDFEFVVAPGLDGKASGALYLDDGISVTPSQTTEVSMSFDQGKLNVSGSFGYKTGVSVARARFLGMSGVPRTVALDGRSISSDNVQYNGTTKVLDVTLNIPFDASFSVQLS